MSKADLARDYFLKGANCAQAIACAFADECGQSPEMMAKLASGFGAGMGRMREVCGAVSGMVLVADLLKGPTDLADKAGKDAQYTLIQDLANQFKAQTGSIICRELLGSGSVFGLTLLPETYNILLFVLPPGAFITLGFLIAIVNKLRNA